MPALSFPPSPAVNDLFTASGKTWKWNGTFWELVVSGASVADGSVSTAKIADGAITAAKIADGTIVAAEIASSAVTTAKIADSNVTTAKIAANAVTQAKLAANVSAVTVTTTANRETDVPSPFTGQLVFLTDTKKVQVWDGSAWLNITMAPPEPPTGLSTIAAPTSVAISFTAGGANGSPITNYKYALSTDGGSTYGAFTALDPADITTPITVSGLSMNTTYHVKLKAVNDLGDSVASAAATFTTEGVPDAPTSLSASNITGSTADIAFTAGAENGAAITNYKFAVSTDDITYGAFTALSPADGSTPITVTGLTSGTLQYIKLKAVNANGDSAASAAVSLTTLSTPSAPTSLSATPSSSSVAISFTPGAQGGSAISNYQYALSTDGGSSYGAFTALNPADATSPITISGLTTGTAYYIKLKAVNDAGAGTESSAVSFTTLLLVDFLVIASGGTNGAGEFASAGGAGGLRSSVSQTGGGCSPEAPLSLILNTQYVVSLGGDATFATVTSLRGGNGTSARGGTGGSGGSGGGGGDFGGPGGSGTACQGYAGGTGQGDYPHPNADGGASGGAGGAGSGSTSAGAGVSNNITGTSVYYAPGRTTFQGSSGHYGSGNGGAPLVILRYPDTRTITIGAGLTGSTTTVSSDKVTTITAGSGNVSWA